MIDRKYLSAALACIAMQAAAPASAEDSECCFRLTPYYWAVGTDGSLEAKGPGGTSEVDFGSDIGDVADNLEFNGSLQLEHNSGHWSNFASVDYLKVDNDDSDIAGVDVELETDATLATVATGYRFSTGEKSWVDLMIGARFAKIDMEAEVAGTEVNGDGDVTDGIVMLRPRIALGKHWAFSPTMAVGAGDSDLVYELAPEFVYTNDCCNLEFRFGYRRIGYEYDEGGAELDFTFAGPMAGVGFAF